MADNKRVSVQFKEEGIAGYASVDKRGDKFESPKGTGDGKYSLKLLVPKGGEAAKRLRAAVAKVAKDAFGKKPNELAGATKQTKGYVACIDGDDSDRAEEHGHWVIPGASAQRPIEAYEILNREFVGTTDVRSGYEVVLFGNFYSNVVGKQEQVCCGANKVLVLKKTGGKLPPEQVFAEELARYSDTIVGRLEESDEIEELDDAGDDWEEEAVAPVVEPKKARKTAAKKEPVAATNGRAPVAVVEPEELDDAGDDWDEL